MRLNEIQFGEARPVQGYGPGFFRIGGTVIEGGALTGPDGPAPWAGLNEAQALLALAGRIDVLLLGMGAEIAHPPADLRAALEDAGIGVEVMSSPAACRSYNVLLAEGRRVALAVLPV